MKDLQNFLTAASIVIAAVLLTIIVGNLIK